MKRLIEVFLSSCGDEDIRAFSQLARGNQADFGSETLLGAISIARIGRGPANSGDSEPFVYVAGLVWQVEIEFSPDIQRSIFAVNRLNCGAAENKLLICAQPTRSDAESCLNALSQPFSAGSGSVYLAFVPHPAEWDASDEQTAVWQLADGAWTAVDALAARRG